MKTITAFLILFLAIGCIKGPTQSKKEEEDEKGLSTTEDGLNNPVVTSNTYDVMAGVPTQGRLPAVSGSGTNGFYTIISPPSKGRVRLIDNKAGDFIYTSSASAGGNDQFDYAYVRNGITSSSARIFISIDKTYYKPSLNPDQIELTNTVIGSTSAVNVFLNDEEIDDGNPSVSPGELTITGYRVLSNQPTQGDLLSTFGIINISQPVTDSYQSAQINIDPFSGQVSVGRFSNRPLNFFIIYEATDLQENHENIAVRSYISVRINGLPNQKPILNNDNYDDVLIGAADYQFYNVLANDADMDGTLSPLTLIITRPGIHGTAVAENGQIKYKANAGVTAQTDTVEYNVQDNEGDFAINPGVVTFNLKANQPPIPAIDNPKVLAGQSVDFDVLANDIDPEGDDLSVTNIIQMPAKGLVTIKNAANGILTYQSNLGDIGQNFSFIYEVSDSFGNKAQGSVNISVLDPASGNNVLVANADTATTLEDASTMINPLANDTGPVGANLSIMGTPSSANATISVVNNQLSYEPNQNFNGTDQFSYTLSDGTSNVVGNITVTVTPVNDAPVADDITIQLAKDAVYLQDWRGGIDVENSPLTYTIVSPPSNGTATVVGAKLQYTPNAGYEGTDSLDYIVNDGQLNSQPGTYTFDVSVNYILESQDHFNLFDSASQAVVLPHSAATALDGGEFDANEAVNKFTSATFRLENKSTETMQILSSDISGNQILKLGGLANNLTIGAGISETVTVGLDSNQFNDMSPNQNINETMTVIYKHLGNNNIYKVTLFLQATVIAKVNNNVVDEVKVRLVYHTPPANMSQTDNDVLSVLNARYNIGGDASIRWKLEPSLLVNGSNYANFSLAKTIDQSFAELCNAHSVAGVVNIHIVNTIGQGVAGIAYVGLEPSNDPTPLAVPYLDSQNQVQNVIVPRFKLSCGVFTLQFTDPAVQEGVVIPHELAHQVGSHHTVHVPLAAGETVPFNTYSQGPGRTATCGADANVSWTVYGPFAGSFTEINGIKFPNQGFEPNATQAPHWNHIMNGWALPNTSFTTNGLYQNEFSKLFRCYKKIVKANLGT